MATASYTINNGTGLAVRTAINNSLAAIQTLNANSTAPADTAPFMLWADTSTNTLKIRNSADNAFIELMQLDGTITLEDGSASTPALANRGDLDTGVFFSAANTFDIATGGVGRFQIDSSEITFNETGADTDFRVEGDSSTHLLFIDAGNDRVGIKSSSPQTALHVGGTIHTTTNLGIRVTSPASNLHVHQDDSDKSIAQFTNTTTGTAAGDGFQIGITSNEDALLNMKETKSIIFKTADTTQMTLDSSGRLLLGTTSTSGISTSGDDIIIGSIGDSTARGITFATTGAGSIRWADAGDNAMGRIQYDNSTDIMTLHTANAEVVRLHSNASISVGTSASRPAEFNTPDGFAIRGDTIGQFQNTVSGQNGLFNRKGSDGTIFGFRQDGTDEGSISVSGTTVSYNGGHLSRWSQLKGISSTDKSARPTIYQGTVMSNLDELCEWKHDDILFDEDVLYTDADTIPEGKKVGDVKHVKGSVLRAAYTEENQQLNMTKVSDTEADKDVAGVFWAWDDDDDEIVNDFYVAMTGDMVIRVAASTTVTRGDLLISAGDGTAKPQDDDIVRSSTIAKIISTNHTATYADGSKAYPCVLMAC